MKIGAKRVRADQLLVDRALAESRTKAQALILAGVVYRDEVRVQKSGDLLPSDAEIDVRAAANPFVSRGGIKLEGALNAFQVNVQDLRCLDLGASTGGFTDCLLQRGAKAVVAVDVGYGQLAQKLRSDVRVTNMERTNGRELGPEDIGGSVDLAVVDASFIGLKQLLPALARCVRPRGYLVALIKPQFEVGRDAISKTKGVVRDEALRQSTIERVLEETKEAGFRVLGSTDCVITGPKGNQEAFVFGERIPQ